MILRNILLEQKGLRKKKTKKSKSSQYITAHKQQKQVTKTVQKVMKKRMIRHLIERKHQIKDYGKYVGTIRKPVKEEVIHKLKYMASPEHRKAFLELEISNMASYTDKTWKKL